MVKAKIERGVYSMFTPRLQQILLILLKTEETTSIKRLAEQIGVSKRTIQRELEYMDGALRPYSIVFQSKTGTGVWLDGAKEEKERLLEDLREMDSIDTGDKSQRRKRLILEMLKDRTAKKLYYYSMMFGVSEATISSDMDAIEKWFERFHLQILRKQGYGVSIEGSEKDYRRAMRSFIDQNMDTEMIRDFYEDRENSLLQLINKKNENTMYRILDKNILKRVLTCIVRMKNSNISCLTEDSYIGLILHITIAINRFLKQEIIEENEALLSQIKKDEEYEDACLISRALEEEFEIEIPLIETAYIWLHLKGAKRQYVKENSSEQDQLNSLVNELIDAYDPNIAYLLKQDDEFIRGLLAHMEPTLIRLKNGMNITNPLLDQIKQDYAVIYQNCQRIAVILQNYVGCEIPDAEIGFLAIHFGAAIVRMENQQEQKRKVWIGVVCASGIGISRLMCTKLAKVFRDRVEITPYGKENITPFIENKTDFFLSSLPMELEGVDILEVSPLLLEEDIEAIEEKVSYYERIPKVKQEEVFTRQLEQINYLAVQIKRILKEMFCMKVDPYIGFEELLVAMTEKLTNYPQRRYQIQEDVTAREHMATQVFPELEFALLHTKTKGTVNPSISFCFTKTLEPFQDPYFKEIRVVILMLMPEDEHSKINSDMLGFLTSSLVEDENLIDTIFEGQEGAIRSELSRCLKSYFNQFLEQTS